MGDQGPSSQRRVRATIEYDGTNFVGWQAQADERGRTVQVALEQAIERITGVASRVIGAGRTDAGVHATGQVIHFDTVWPRGMDELERAMVAVLPPDVVVTELAEVQPDFHARFDAREREYVYSILNQPRRSPLLRHLAWRVPEPLDVAVMQAAGQRLVGRHDFRAFGRPMRPTGTSIRTVLALTVESRELDSRVLAENGCLKTKIINITVRADAFLRHMVRRIVYALVEVGRGRLTPEAVEAILASADPNQLHGMAPPQGLCLVRVIYEGDRGSLVGDFPESQGTGDSE